MKSKTKTKKKAIARTGDVEQLKKLIEKIEEQELRLERQRKILNLLEAVVGLIKKQRAEQPDKPTKKPSPKTAPKRRKKR